MLQHSYNMMHMLYRLPDSPTSGPYYTSDGVLVLAHAVPADSGNYTCTATNARGNLSASTDITIESPKIYGIYPYNYWVHELAGCSHQFLRTAVV